MKGGCEAQGWMKGGCEAEGRVGGVNNEKGILTHGNGCCEQGIQYSIVCCYFGKHCSCCTVFSPFRVFPLTHCIFSFYIG